MAQYRCFRCGSGIIHAGIGRPPRWCSPECRRKGNYRIARLRESIAQAAAEGRPLAQARDQAWLDRLEGRDPSWPPSG